MELCLVDKLQLKRIEKKISKKKKYLEKHPIQLEKGELYSVKIVLFASKFWFRENVKKVLENNGYKVVQIPLCHKTVVSWR